MAPRLSREPLRFYRAAARRLEEAEFLLREGDNNFTTGAVYLAGYAVECMLKVLILASEPARRHPATLRTFRGAEAHRFEWLKARLSEQGIALPPPVVRDLSGVNWWTTSLRYDPKVIRRREAEAFLGRVKQVLDWVRGRL